MNTTTFAAIVVILAFGIAGNADYAEDRARELRAAQRIESMAQRYAHQLANCMNGGAIFWQDPHTLQNVGAFCDIHVVPIAPPAPSKTASKGGNRT